MKKWTGRIAGALGMGVAWAAGWGVVGLLIGLVVDADGAMDEMWPAIGAYPGFVAGLIFFVLLALVGREPGVAPSRGRAGVLGAGAGLLPAIFPFAVVAAMTSRADYPVVLLGIAIMGATTLMSVALAVGSTRLMRPHA